MQTIDILADHATIIMDLYNKTGGLVDLIVKLQATNELLASVSEANYRKLLPGFIKGMETANKRIAELENQLNSERNMFIELANAIDTLPVIDMLPVNDTIPNDVNNDVNTIVNTVVNNEQTVVNTSVNTELNDSVKSILDGLLPNAIESLLPILAGRVANILGNATVNTSVNATVNATVNNGVNSSVATVNKPDLTLDGTPSMDTDSGLDIPKKIKGFYVIKRQDSKYVLVDRKTTIYIGKTWDMDKALRLIAAKETSHNPSQALLLA